MDVTPLADRAVEAPRRAGARFAYLHGSVGAGTSTAHSDLDVAAWFGRPSVHALAYLDEQPRVRQGRRDFVAARAHGRP